MPRREDSRLLSGRGRFVANTFVPGMGYAAFARSSVARARLVAVDTSQALAHPGVTAVLLASDLATVAPGSLIPTLYAGAPGAPVRLLAGGDVRYVGEPVALVVADDPYAAADGADLVDIEYDPLQPVVDFETAGASTVVVNPERGSNVAATSKHSDPSCDEAMRRADRVVTATVRQQRQANAPMEPRGVVAAWEPGPSLVAYVSTQNPHEVRQVLARAFALPQAAVRVLKGDVGGGFGQKFLLLSEEIAVVAGARLTGRALKWIEARQENLTSATHARADLVTASVALDGQGTMLAMDVDHVEDVGAVPMGGSGGAGASVVTRFTGPYTIPALSWRTTAVHTNTCRRGAYRAPWMMETTAREQLVDEAARQLGMDPLELRRRNVIQSGDQPFRSPGGMVIDGVTLAECLDEAAKVIDYSGFRSRQAELRRADRYQGLGISLFFEPQGSVAAIRAESATVRLDPDGTVSVAVGSGNHGQGLETTIAQVVADQLGLDMEAVRVHDGDTNSTPFGNGTGGSRSGPILTPAAVQAAATLRQRILGIASHHLEAAVEDLRLGRGEVFVLGTPSRSVVFATIGQLASAGAAALPPEVEANLHVTATYRMPGPVFSNACHMSICEVDVDTGTVKLLRYVVTEDCGSIINPRIVEGQISGGVAQGIGGALYEQVVYDEDGNPLTATFVDYTIPGFTEVPSIEYHHVAAAGDPGEPPDPLYKGVGESGAIGAPSCVANAVADALAPFGVGIIDPPITPAAVRVAMDRAQDGRAAPTIS
ncbi:MAG: xanthine dehydrogenase family protein [Acidimicrobiales bacterium]|nr:xanthine dehydrogenase family protein [Acidimicrobiales bacterium]